jgi:hypothetical protein
MLNSRELIAELVQIAHSNSCGATCLGTRFWRFAQSGRRRVRQNRGPNLVRVPAELSGATDLQCCSWENYMPAARLALYQLGIEYIQVFYISADSWSN